MLEIWPKQERLAFDTKLGQSPLPKFRSSSDTRTPKPVGTSACVHCGFPAPRPWSVESELPLALPGFVNDVSAVVVSALKFVQDRGVANVSVLPGVPEPSY